MGSGLLREGIAAFIFAFVVEAGTDIRKLIVFMGNVLTADPSAGIAPVGGCIPIIDSIKFGNTVCIMDAPMSAAIALAIGIIIPDRAFRMEAPYAATAITHLGTLLPCGIAVRAGVVAGVAAGKAGAVRPADIHRAALLMAALHGAAGIGALAILIRPIVGGPSGERFPAGGAETFRFAIGTLVGGVVAGGVAGKAGAGFGIPRAFAAVFMDALCTASFGYACAAASVP